MFPSARKQGRPHRALVLCALLTIGWCALATADEFFDDNLSAIPSGDPSGVVETQWLRENLREIFAPLDTPWPAQAESTNTEIATPAAVWDEPLPPTSTRSEQVFTPTTDLFDGLTLFGGLDGSKQPQDLGVNANMGGRLAATWGRPIVLKWGLGVQAGIAYNFADNAVQVLHRLGVSDWRDQYFTTFGIFQRTDWGFNWSFAHDGLWETYYNSFYVSQWRGRAGYYVTDTDEVGVWGTIADGGDSGTVLGAPVHLRPISQANFFWRHTWASSAWTTFWIGSAKQHGTFVLGFPDTAPVKDAFVYGADLQIPLNDSWSLCGEANFITPASSGTVDAYLGFAFYPGRGVRQALQKRYAPLLPTASNVSFAVDLAR
jgi:hypothetical protein